MSRRRAFITGISGQDGSYLLELLLEKDYEVYGLLRRTSTSNRWRLAGIEARLRLIPGDVTDHSSLIAALRLSNPHEIYHLASQSYVAHSFEAPLHTGDVTGLGALRVFEAARLTCPHARIYQASSSEQFGNPVESPQNEATPFNPVSPYGCAKTFAHFCATTYRQAYKMFIACGIAFNHESPRRGKEFVTQKIAQGVAAIQRGDCATLTLGNVETKRDWSHASDIMAAAWAMLQQEIPGDYVLASGVSHSVKEFAQRAFHLAGLEFSDHLLIDVALYRPTDVLNLVGNSQKAKTILGWSPYVTFDHLVEEMMQDALHPTQPSDSLREVR